MKKKLTCLAVKNRVVCGHQWIQRRKDTPVECPKCRSRKYNKPVKEG